MNETEKLPTIGELGQRLAIGYIDPTNGKRHVDFTLKPWNWDMEEAVGALSERNPDQRIGAFTTDMLALAIERVGDKTFADMAPGMARNLLVNMYFADVLTIFVWVRVGALGPDVQIHDIKCSHCAYKFDDKKPFVGDLRGCEIKVIEEAKEIFSTHEVKGGFTYAGKKYSKLAIGPLRWAFYDQMGAGTWTNKAKYSRAVIKDGVIGVVNEDGIKDPAPFVLTDDFLRSMSVNEVKRLVRSISEINGGPVMAVEGICPNCQGNFTEVVNWTYPSFFGTSSP